MYYLLLYIVLNRIHKDFRSTWLLKAYDFYLTGALLTRKLYFTRLQQWLQPFVLRVFTFFSQKYQKVYSMTVLIFIIN